MALNDSRKQLFSAVTSVTSALEEKLHKSIKHPVPDQVVKPSFVIFDIWALWRWALNVRVPRCQKITNDGLTRSYTHITTVDVKVLRIPACRTGQLYTWCINNLCIKTSRFCPTLYTRSQACCSSAGFLHKHQQLTYTNLQYITTKLETRSSMDNTSLTKTL